MRFWYFQWLISESEVKLFPGTNAVANDTIEEQGLGFRFGYQDSTRDRRNRLFNNHSFLELFCVFVFVFFPVGIS